MTEQAHSRGHDWEHFRDYLSLLARLHADARWRGKLDLSGVVQQTLLEAFQAGQQLADASDAQKAAWLKRALANNLADEVRKLTAARRNARRERSLEAAMNESISHMERLLPDGQATPSQEAVMAERAVRLAQALTILPENQREVIERHYLRGQTLVEVATAMDTTRPAIAGLLHRGLKALRRNMKEDGTEEQSQA